MEARQTSIFDADQQTGEQRKNEGMRRAIDHADRKEPNWSDKAFIFLRKYMIGKKEFMVEDVRIAANGIVSDPPSNRAWGAVVVRAKKQGLIESLGYRTKKNADAHKTPAILWMVIYEETGRSII